MPDERTQMLNLPLPHPGHLLSEDVLRLREALVTVDAEFAQQRTEVQAAMAQTRSEVDAALAATTTAVANALDEVGADMQRRIRRLQLNQLLNLHL